MAKMSTAVMATNVSVTRSYRPLSTADLLRFIELASLSPPRERMHIIMYATADASAPDFRTADSRRAEKKRSISTKYFYRRRYHALALGRGVKPAAVFLDEQEHGVENHALERNRKISPSIRQMTAYISFDSSEKETVS